MASTKDFRIAIVGGGMCGIACAIGLAARGIHADVFEAAPEFGQHKPKTAETGLNAIKALEGLGILEPVMKKTDTGKPTLRSFIFISGPGKHEVIYDYSKHSGQYGLGIYRPAFLEALLPLLNPHCLHLNKKCTLVAPLASGGYRLEFEDGTEHEAEIVVGADGIKSTVRGFVVGSERSNLVFANTVAYRALVPHEALLKAGVETVVDRMPVCWMGNDKHIITFPMQGTDKINVVLFASNYSKRMGPQLGGPWVEGVPKSEIIALYNDMGSDAKMIVNHVNNASKWYIHAVSPTLPSYLSGRVVLIGDSAHGMLPHLGAGVGQGFKDVYVLCRLLSHPGTKRSNLDSVLSVYDKLRPRRANMVLEESARAGRIYDSFGKSGFGVDRVQRELAGIWEPVWHHDLKREVDEALNELEGNSAMLYTKSRL